MIANFFNKTKPINFLALSVMMFIIYSIAAIFVFSGEFSITYFFKKSFYLSLAIFMLFIFDFIIRKNMLTQDNSFALFFYVLFFGFFPFSFENKSLLVTNFFLLLSFRKIYSLRTSFKTKEKIFDSSFWIGVASLIYDWSFVYIILLYMAIIIFWKNDWKNFFIPIIGFITPLFLIYVYFLATNNLIQFYEIWHLDYSFNYHNYKLGTFFYPILFILAFVLISIYPTTTKSLSKKKDFKATWTVLIFQTGLSLFLVVLAPIKNGSEFIFLFFPLSILFTNYFQYIKRYWLKEVILYLFLIIYISIYLL